MAVHSEPKSTMTEIESIVFRYVSRPPSVMYDLGVGLKTEWQTISAAYPDCSLFGCEPNPKTFEALRDIFPGQIVDVAIGDGTQDVLRHPADESMAGSLYRGGEVEHTVDVWTLDQFDDFAGRPSGVLLWMDIEGGELVALESGRNLLESGRVDAINLEERLDGLCDPIAIRRLLAGHGYRKVCEYANHETHRDAIFTK